jgi:hypothetical protein
VSGIAFGPSFCSRLEASSLVKPAVKSRISPDPNVSITINAPDAISAARVRSPKRINAPNRHSIPGNIVPKAHTADAGSRECINSARKLNPNSPGPINMRPNPCISRFAPSTTRSKAYPSRSSFSSNPTPIHPPGKNAYAGIAR